jgi:SAM-dependent methyltransferase
MMCARPADPKTIPSDAEDVVAAVRSRYGSIADGSVSACCGPQTSCCGDPATATATEIGYRPADLDLLPEGANLGLGCGAPLDHLAPQPGETVLDLGSGAGIDALIAARAVGPAGRVIGVDMTPEMIDKAVANAAAADVGVAEFREGRLESLPVSDASVDAVTSNCVINLVPDKAVVFAEIARVLRPGGRLVISDVVLDGELPDIVSTDLLSYVGCVAGALQRVEYFDLLERAGLTDLEIVKDVDFVKAVGNALPPELAELAAATGVTPADIEGIVRSITYRAWKK